jgi:hypothetical protein
LQAQQTQPQRMRGRTHKRQDTQYHTAKKCSPLAWYTMLQHE